jgi:hypothetical protein
MISRKDAKKNGEVCNSDSYEFIYDFESKKSTSFGQ